MIEYRKMESTQHVSYGIRRKVERYLHRYEIVVDGDVVGEVGEYMVTRERKSKGKRYVNSRWSSPAWEAFGKSRSNRTARHLTRQSAAESYLRLIGRAA